MKIFIKFLCPAKFGISVLLTSCLLSAWDADAQSRKYITGKLVDEKSGLPVSFATVSLLRITDSLASRGGFSNEDGHFTISPVSDGKYILKVTGLGFEQVSKYVEVTGEGETYTGIISLKETPVMLDELIVTGERVKATAENDRTTYNITEKMVNASATGTDLLKLVPGIQVDLMQNISLEGSLSIMIYVDGRERDKGFINQLNPNDVDRVEVISIPPSEFDGNLTGAINIIMKKKTDSGVSGQVLAELPASRSVVYIFPAYNLSYSYKRLNIYTSYSGEFIFLDQMEKNSREYRSNTDTVRIETIQDVRQKNMANKFHYGIDYFPDDKNIFNFYAYYYPYSHELDGHAHTHFRSSDDSLWRADRDDSDKNRSVFYSLYYKHKFNDRAAISSDLSWYNLKAENITSYRSENSEGDPVVENRIKPLQDMFSIKIDYTDLLFSVIDFSSGLKAKFQQSANRQSAFCFHEHIYALYANLDYKLQNFNIAAGLRVEQSAVELENSFRRTGLSFFPYAGLRYQVSSRQKLQLTYNRSIRRPNLHQLNPYISFDDPWSTSTGNPFLRDEFLSSVYLQHSLQFSGNFLSTRLFFNRADNVINNLTLVNGSGIFESSYHNLGYMSQYGIQFSGSLKAGPLTLNPFIRIYDFFTSGNELARNHNIESRRKAGLESSMSVIMSFKHDLAFSGTFQYNTSKFDIQSRTFSDMTYFLSLEKTFMKKYRAGLASAIPFTRRFTYNGSEISTPEFHSLYQGEVLMTSLPIWFRLGYTFSSGNSREKISREKEEVQNLRKKGF